MRVWGGGVGDSRPAGTAIPVGFRAQVWCEGEPLPGSARASGCGDAAGPRVRAPALLSAADPRAGAGLGNTRARRGRPSEGVGAAGSWVGRSRGYVRAGAAQQWFPDRSHPALGFPGDGRMEQ